MILPQLRSTLAYGGDYNPEQWPEATWHDDMRLMRDAGVNLVSVGVFAWSWVQPTEKRFDFRGLDRVLELLAEHGIHAALGTATASPPPWLAARHPDVRAVDADGLTHHHGSRQYYSPCSPSYRRYAAALTERIAQRYARHPALALWHVNNEYGNHVSVCHSLAAVRGFQAWLRRKYGSLAALNEAWGTLFWSQRYAAWREVDTPRRTPFTPNPTQQLDYARYMSDALRELYTMERDILRAANPAIPITTNLMGFHKPVNGFDWAREVDVVAWNSYPDPAPGARGEQVAAAGHDLARSLRKDRPFILMEQAPAWVNWLPGTATKRPGVLRLWTLQAIARGADAAMFFQWRASKYGAEKFMSGMVPHLPAEESRVFAEAKATGKDLAALSAVTGSRVRSRIAILLDWEAWWAVELAAKPARFEYLEAVRAAHRYFYTRNLPVDFVRPGERLDDYRLVVAPMLYLLGEKPAADIEGLVRGGGIFVATYFSGIVDENDHVVLGGYPARLRAVLGLCVEEWSPLAPGETTRVRFGGRRGRELPGTHWCDVIRLEGAEAVATFAEDFFAGRAAVTRHRCGRGVAYYVGTRLADEGLAQVLDPAVAEAGVAALLPAPADVEITLREKDGARFLFVLNHRPGGVRVPLEGHRGLDLLTGREVRGPSLALAGRGVAVVKLAR